MPIDMNPEWFKRPIGINLNSAVVQSAMENDPELAQLAQNNGYYGSKPRLVTAEEQDDDSVTLNPPTPRKRIRVRSPEEIYGPEKVRMMQETAPKPVPEGYVGPIPEYIPSGAMNPQLNQDAAAESEAILTRYPNQPVQVQYPQMSQQYYPQQQYPQQQFYQQQQFYPQQQYGGYGYQQPGYENLPYGYKPGTPDAYVYERTHPYPGGSPPVPPAGQEYIPAVPQYMYGMPSGTLFGSVDAYKYPGVNDNEYDPLPSAECLARYYQQQQQQCQPVTFMQGYSNPYMPNRDFSQPIYLPPQNNNAVDPYYMARHNYALQSGYASLQELEEVELENNKMASRACHRFLKDMTEEQLEEHLRKKYDEPFNRRWHPEMFKDEKPKNPVFNEFNWNESTDEKQLIKDVKIVRGGEVIYEHKGHVDGRKYVYMMDSILEGIRNYHQYRARMDQIVWYLHNTALERKFDRYSVVQFFNEAFYELDFEERQRDWARMVNSRKANSFNTTLFKREVLKRAGPAPVREKIMDEDLRFRVNDPLPEGWTRGKLGELPNGQKTSPSSDPRIGFCFTMDPHGVLHPGVPRTDGEMEEVKRFALSVGTQRKEVI